MVINADNKIGNFSGLIGDGKEKFVINLICRQLDLAIFMSNVYSGDILLRDHAILVEAVEKSNIPKVLGKWLNGTISFDEFTHAFISYGQVY